MHAAHRKLPENTSIVIPRLVCRDPAAEVAFCVRALDAESLNERAGPDGSLAHALLKIGPEMVMIETEWPSLPSRAPAMDATSPVVVFLYVPDVDETVARATECGASVVVPLANQFWGDRTAWLMDPAGHVWTVATRVEQTTAEERSARWSAALGEHARREETVVDQKQSRTMLAHPTPELPVEDVGRAQRHYRDSLAFEIGWSTPEGELGAVSRDDVAIFLRRRSRPFEPAVHWVYAADIDATYEELRSSGARIVEGLEKKPWGMRQFTVEDLDGNRFYFHCD